MRWLAFPGNRSKRFTSCACSWECEISLSIRLSPQNLLWGGFKLLGRPAWPASGTYQGTERFLRRDWTVAMGFNRQIRLNAEGTRRHRCREHDIRIFESTGRSWSRLSRWTHSALLRANCSSSPGCHSPLPAVHRSMVLVKAPHSFPPDSTGVLCLR